MLAVISDQSPEYNYKYEYMVDVCSAQVSINSHLNSIWVFSGTYLVLTMTPGPSGRYSLPVTVSLSTTLTLLTCEILKDEKRNTIEHVFVQSFSGLYSDLEL